MSEYTKKALFSRLTGSDALTELLGTDENNGPAIFNATMNQKLQDLENPETSWTDPCVTFRETDGSADSRFRTETIDNEICDIEVWARTSSALVIPRIAAEVDKLLHNQDLTLESGENYDCVRFAQQPDLYDDKIKFHFGLYRYRLVVRR
jgi:hypothetical protein